MEATSAGAQLIDLSHRITEGMVTYPGLPVPIVGTHLSREAAEQIYAPGTTFHIGVVTMCTNTGTYLDVPFHRYADGHDLAALPLERVAGDGAGRHQPAGRRYAGHVAVGLSLAEIVRLCATAAFRAGRRHGMVAIQRHNRRGR